MDQRPANETSKLPSTSTKQSRSRSREESPIPEPEPAHIPDGVPDHEREATELREQELPERPAARVGRGLGPSLAQESWFDPVTKFWRQNIHLSVPHDKCRDHLANERTFLGYLRTSVFLSMIGALIAQLWRLQHSANPDPVFGYHAISKPLSALFHVSALGTVLLGACRYWRQQGAMARGRVHAGGWELGVIAVFSTLLLVTLFALHVALDIDHTYMRGEL